MFTQQAPPGMAHWISTRPCSPYGTHMLVITDENYPGPGVSFGRLDQYLYPFYRTSFETGMGMDGKDMTNELTYLLLDVINEISPILEPKPNVRLHCASICGFGHYVYGGWIHNREVWVNFFKRKLPNH